MSEDQLLLPEPQCRALALSTLCGVFINIQLLEMDQWIQRAFKSKALTHVTSVYRDVLFYWKFPGTSFTGWFYSNLKHSFHCKQQNEVLNFLGPVAKECTDI